MRILVVSHGVIGDDNGVGRVHHQLMDQYRKAGHHVDKIDYLDFYPKGQNHFSKIFGKTIGEKAFDFLKRNATAYDVIDANSECIIHPKKAFGFEGLLFLRSHGARPLGKRAEKISSVAAAFKKEKDRRSLKTRVGSIVRSLYRTAGMSQFYQALRYADLVHCLNEVEYNFLTNCGVLKERIVFIPNGLPIATISALQLLSFNRKSNSETVSFIAAWRIMKGIKDWREISKSLVQIPGFNQILLLGTAWPEAIVRGDFEKETLPYIKIVNHFQPRELPEMLKDVKLGIFTSYTEGFCYAVLEQLASGIPVVAYDVSGVGDLLRPLDPSLLVKPGDINSLVERAKEILKMDADDYEILSQKCTRVACRYALEDLAPLYLKSFENFLIK